MVNFKKEKLKENLKNPSFLKLLIKNLRADLKEYNFTWETEKSREKKYT